MRASVNAGAGSFYHGELVARGNDKKSKEIIAWHEVASVMARAANPAL